MSDATSLLERLRSRMVERIQWNSCSGAHTVEHMWWNACSGMHIMERTQLKVHAGCTARHFASYVVECTQTERRRHVGGT